MLVLSQPGSPQFCSLTQLLIILLQKNRLCPPAPAPVQSLCSWHAILDGLDLPTDLLRGEAVEPALPGDYQDSEEQRQSQHGRLELPEEMFLDHSGATAVGTESEVVSDASVVSEASSLTQDL